MDEERIAVVAGVTTIGYVAASIVLDELMRSAGRGGTVERLLALDGSYWPGVLYGTLLGTADTLVLVGLGVALGYSLGRDVDLARHHGRFLRAVGAGTGVAAGAVWAMNVVDGWTWGRSGVSVAYHAASLVNSLVQIALVLTVCAFAGAALAQYRVRDAGESDP